MNSQQKIKMIQNKRATILLLEAEIKMLKVELTFVGEEGVRRQLSTADAKKIMEDGGCVYLAKLDRGESHGGEVFGFCDESQCCDGFYPVEEWSEIENIIDCENYGDWKLCEWGGENGEILFFT
tara:strand:+ start:5947 stop:6318 length:372 start_codon:yes stop_codon:yes gene_type:complete